MSTDKKQKWMKYRYRYQNRYTFWLNCKQLMSETPVGGLPFSNLCLTFRKQNVPASLLWHVGQLASLIYSMELQALMFYLILSLALPPNETKRIQIRTGQQIAHISWSPVCSVTHVGFKNCISWGPCTLWSVLYKYSSLIIWQLCLHKYKLISRIRHLKFSWTYKNTNIHLFLKTQF